MNEGEEVLLLGVIEGVGMFNVNVYVIVAELEEKSCAKLPIIIASR